ncbi:carbohydrate ABC transporter substrate-binding protein, CUT1 family [Natronoarchaeum philippinense]|uniref:Carbohydrate ABC transporter substrate-binding protein, CUT1 family n=1 Tax=Natronoarchaeum philippinense TaxID=558529 RepID=A0A285NSF8_NATPI|nr:ABC transporter substrate-binding protein [Natronoarchaeum philippinense]SNZ12452.1 carbohydrate ABC transporter substrate-binding protein, CUT1 family [Natronoarchaeum philippinense]
MTDPNTGRNRRTVLQGIGAAMAAGSLAGCLGGGGSDSEGATYWTTQVEQDRQDVLSSLIDSFESDSEDSIDMIAVEEGDLPTQISSARASGTLPAFGEWGLDPMQNLGSEGLLSTESAQAVVESIGRDDFADGAISLATSSDGNLLAVPAHGWVQGFWYRQSAFDDAGLSAPTTWDSILEAAETLHDPDNDQYGIVVGSDETPFARQCFTPYARSNGARVLNADGEIVFDSQEMIEALDFYGSLAQYSPPGADTFETANNTYLNEQCHMIMYSSYIMGDIASNTDGMAANTSFAPYIERERRSSFGQLVLFNILDSASDADRETAEAFIEHVLTGEQYVDFLHMAPGGMNPVLSSTAQSEAYRDNETLQAWGQDTLEDISGAFDNIERFGYVDGQMIPAFGEITNRSLVAQAVRRVSEGEDAETVATDVADQMRNVIN